MDSIDLDEEPSAGSGAVTAPEASADSSWPDEDNGESDAPDPSQDCGAEDSIPTQDTGVGDAGVGDAGVGDGAVDTDGGVPSVPPGPDPDGSSADNQNCVTEVDPCASRDDDGWVGSENCPEEDAAVLP